MKPDWIITGIVLTCLVIGAVILVSYQIEQKTRIVYKGSSEPFMLATLIPASPATAPMYRVVGKDSIFEGTPKSLDVKNSIPSETEAPALAEKALEKYGGLPNDAVLYKVERVTVKKYNTKTGVIEEESPQFTQVIYLQQINGTPVIGPGAEINIELGENGELLSIEKAWRYVEYAGEVNIITAAEAYEKLKKGEIITLTQSSPIGKIVTDIRLGYYAEHREKDQKTYTPVWIFYAAREGQTPFPYPVDAMK